MLMLIHQALELFHTKNLNLDCMRFPWKGFGNHLQRLSIHHVHF